MNTKATGILSKTMVSNKYAIPCLCILAKTSFPYLLLTYGDGVSNVNIKELVDFHKAHDGAITVTAVQPEGRFGSLDIGSDSKVNAFVEKPKGDGAWINAGYFVCEPKVFDYITEGDPTVFEQKPLKRLADEGELFTFKHESFWRCMDTLRDKEQLEEMWEHQSPWRVWND